LKYFKTYLNEWEKEKFHKEKENKKMKSDSTPPMKKKVEQKKERRNYTPGTRNKRLRVTKTARLTQVNTSSLYSI